MVVFGLLQSHLALSWQGVQGEHPNISFSFNVCRKKIPTHDIPVSLKALRNAPNEVSGIEAGETGGGGDRVTLGGLGLLGLVGLGLLGRLLAGVRNWVELAPGEKDWITSASLGRVSRAETMNM